MKKRMKQLMAVMLSVALCVPAIPGAYGYAATSGTTFTQEEEIALSGLGSERSTLFNDGWKFSLSDPSGAESTSFNDGSWDAVTLRFQHQPEFHNIRRSRKRILTGRNRMVP